MLANRITVQQPYSEGAQRLGSPRVLLAFLLRQGTLSPPGFAGREGYLYIDKETSGFSLMTPPSALEGLS